MGDFNIDLLKTTSEQNVSYFYDFLSSFGFRPLIHQPTRVTASSATLIDNIFVNSIETESIGVNITTSISDHFSQFCAIDILKKPKNILSPKRQRTFKNFSYVEFENELNNINWSVLLQNKKSDDALKSFYDTIEKLLDEMAPYKTLSKKEQNLQQRPWVSGDILSEMHTRNEIHKKFIKEKKFLTKGNLFSEYKKKRNDVLSKIKNSRNNYFKDFFESHKSDIKKTWQGIKNIVNVNKKQSTLPTKLLYKNKTHDNDDDIAKRFNTFFTNIGNTVEEKIPTTETHFSQFLHNKPQNSLFLQPVTEAEVC